MVRLLCFLTFVGLLGLVGKCQTKEAPTLDIPTVDLDHGSSREASRTDSELPMRKVEKNSQKIRLDGLSPSQYKELHDKAENYTFQTEVNRMMKLIINSLYRNKNIFLRELISNASDALDKIRLLSLTMPGVLDATNELSIKIKVDKDNHMLHITDTGIGMTRNDLIKNLGTIAKSGTADFLSKLNDQEVKANEMNDMIGQFGVGFYSAFLVADNVIVTSKHNDDAQQIWESDSSTFSIAEDPRGPTLKRGTQISLQLKPEDNEFADLDNLKSLVKRYSQFITFPIYLWSSKTIKEEVPIEVEEKAAPDEGNKKNEEEEDEVVEEVKEEKDEKPKTQKVEKTVWDWELLNDNKPIWTRKAGEVSDKEYNEFYKSLTKDDKDPLAKTHFTAEGEVSFKSLLFVPRVQPADNFSRYGTTTDNIKLYVRRVFITDEFSDIVPKYLSFLRGIVDSDDLPLNVSREMLQHHKLLKVIKKKLVRKTLDMLKKMDEDTYKKFWKEYSTNIKLGMFEDPHNRVRLSKLLRFQSSASEKDYTSLSDYVARMKPEQENIFYIAGSSRDEVQKSPFIEKLLSKGYEVLYLIDAVDEYAFSSLPEFEGKKFQNAAKEGLSISKNKNKLEELSKEFEKLTSWLSETVLKEFITKATLSERLTDSPAALVASMFGWTGNMERLAMANAHQKSEDSQRDHYLKQKKNLEINPRHPIIRDLLRRVLDDKDDPKAKEIALMLYRTAMLRSGFMVRDTHEFALALESMMKETLGISPDEKVQDFDEDEEEESKSETEKADQETTAEEIEAEEEEKRDEL